MNSRNLRACTKCLTTILPTAVGLCIVVTTYLPADGQQSSFAEVSHSVQAKIVKVYGAGGVGGLESYQSGFMISADGHLLTAASYVLDTDRILIVLDDGQRFDAEIVGMDPRLEIAVLKIAAVELDYFDLSQSPEIDLGARVLAFSNLFGVAVGDEAASVLHGVVTAKTSLAARRGAFELPYRGPVYVVDAVTNNPGAAGGALTDREGNLVGMLGKELRNALDNTWLNYALPISELQASVLSIRAGEFRTGPRSVDRRRPLEPVNLSMLGIALVPDVLANTPPYVDSILFRSTASEAGLRADDLILSINDQTIRSIAQLKEELSYTDRIDEVRLLVQRQQQLLEFSLFAPEPSNQR